MTQHENILQAKRAEILERLRANLGEDRDGELGDVDGVSLLTNFLRRLPGEDDDEGTQELSKTELGDLRRYRRKRRREGTPTQVVPELDIDSDTIPMGSTGENSLIEAIKFETLVEEIPRLRDNFSEWLSSIDAEYTPNSSSIQELEQHRANVEFRLKALTVMLNATQQELDDLIVTIRAKQTVQGQ